MKKAAAFSLAFLVTLPLALALASCSGGAPQQAATPEATSTPAPTAVATPEAASPTAVATPEDASTPAPTATPTPEAASTLTPEQACANGVAVAEPWANPRLVADCEALLRAKDALRGDASLDWGGGLAVAGWEGVAVSGEPPRVTGLDLRGKGLTGPIPRELRRLRLGEVRLAGNALAGCVPSAFEDASGDAASLGLPWCLRYDRLDAAGEVASAGEWAILGGNGEALTTWEQLRSEAATLRVHQTDAGGTSWASEFGAVAEGDLFEWRMADDCWVRYHVTGAPVAPSGASGRWEFPVEWMTYAATGAGCEGAVGTSAVLRADEAAPDVIPAIAITSPVRHRTFLVSPPGWTGALDPETVHEPPGPAPEGFGGPGSAIHAAWVPYVYTADLAEARRLPYWSDPALPPGWTFANAESGGHYAPFRGYCASYHNELGDLGADICAYYMVLRPQYHSAISTSYGRPNYEPRVIGGRAGIVGYSPLGPAHDRLQSTSVWVFDDDTGVEYEVFGRDRHFRGNNIEPVIEIARSLLPPTDTP